MAVKKKAKAKTAKKTPAKKAAGKKAPAKKAPGKKTPAKKAAAKKVAAKTPRAPKAPAAAEPATPTDKPAPKAAPKRAEGSSAKRVKVTLVKSVHGRLAAHKACAIGLGLRRRHQTVEVEDTPCTRGMINKIRYMLEVEGQ